MKKILIPIFIAIFMLMVAVVFLTRPALSAGEYKTSRWQLLNADKNEYKTAKLEIMTRISILEVDDSKADAAWREQTDLCCKRDAKVYASWLSQIGLTHRQYVELVAVNSYYSQLSDKEWKEIEDKYPAEPNSLKDWWQKDLAPSITNRLS